MDSKHKEKITRELENKEEIILCAAEFGVMGDETRLKICYLLCKYPKLSVTEISEVLGLTLSAVSHSLSKLKSNNLVSSTKEKQVVYYSLEDTKFTNYIKSTLGVNN